MSENTNELRQVGVDLGDGITVAEITVTFTGVSTTHRDEGRHQATVTALVRYRKRTFAIRAYATQFPATWTFDDFRVWEDEAHVGRVASQAIRSRFYRALHKHLDVITTAELLAAGTVAGKRAEIERLRRDVEVAKNRIAATEQQILQLANEIRTIENRSA